MTRPLQRLLLPILLLALVACGGESLFPTGPAESGADPLGGIVAQVTNAGAPAGGLEVVLGQDVVRTTDAQGRAHFAELAPGPYTVTLLVPAGFVLDPGQETVRNVTVSAGGTATVVWSIRPQDGAGGNPGF